MARSAVLMPPVAAVCFDWGGTLMLDDGPDDVPMVEWPTLTAVQGAADCLAALHGWVPLYVATNASASSRAMIIEALERVGLDRFFADVFCFTAIGFRKTQPEFWHRVRQLIDVPFEHIVMVGDSLEKDVLVPRRLGVQSVWFNPSGKQSEASVPAVFDLTAFADMVAAAARVAN
jgi:FMN phosphatase YigB (HAD superfamily)